MYCDDGCWEEAGTLVVTAARSYTAVVRLLRWWCNAIVR